MGLLIWAMTLLALFLVGACLELDSWGSGRASHHCTVL